MIFGQKKACAALAAQAFFILSILIFSGGLEPQFVLALQPAPMEELSI